MMAKQEYCKVCGVVDAVYDEHNEAQHSVSPKHVVNTILYKYKMEKKSFSRNRDSIHVFCTAQCEAGGGNPASKTEKTSHHKIRIYVRPMQKAKFTFDISNDSNKEEFLIVGIMLAHPQPHFVMKGHPYLFGGAAHTWQKKTSIKEEISVMFQAADIGQYEMPIIFTFQRKSDKKNIIFVREMVIIVEENPSQRQPYVKSPYTDEYFEKAEHCIAAVNGQQEPEKYKIPYLLKILLPRGLDEDKVFDSLQVPADISAQLRDLLTGTRAIFDEGISKENYMIYFHHLLWWEEVIARINIKKFNMKGVPVEKRNYLGVNLYYLEVPGLAEKRPSLIRGDKIFLQPQEEAKVMFECIVKNIEDNHIQLSKLSEQFDNYYSPDALFDVRFLISRVPYVRGHEAVTRLYSSNQVCRLFPVRGGNVQFKKIPKFYNKLIQNNEEQRSAVEHIVSGTSGKAPYIVFGPPGTGKTMTIVEAIVQLVVRSHKNRILVCTDSNMAADHIAAQLLPYGDVLNIDKFILRANSQSREWSSMPPVLAPVSNGTSYDDFVPLNLSLVGLYRIVVTTLLHAAKYVSNPGDTRHKLQITHLFIDEAAQATEPNCLVPITGLLSPGGQLVLAGDPRQLGPVCISKEANSRGLGTSLMERLRLTHSHLYSNDPNFITMLVRNFRSDPDILHIPNELFYDKQLQPFATPDPLSRQKILPMPGGERAVVFHALESKEQRMGKTPSYFNEKELEMVKRYVNQLIDTHGVLPSDIGVIAPYIRQVYKIKEWLASQDYKSIEVGTVEAFQGKEKRVILVSTVRANCRLLDYDAKYGLGFLVDDKRYTVTLTRAKAKLVIIGNPACLSRDVKWRKYMEFCKQLNTYIGQEYQQLKRDTDILKGIKDVLDVTGITKAMHEKKEANKDEEKVNKKKKKKKAKSTQ